MIGSVFPPSPSPLLGAWGGAASPNLLILPWSPFGGPLPCKSQVYHSGDSKGYRSCVLGTRGNDQMCIISRYHRDSCLSRALCVHSSVISGGTAHFLLSLPPACTGCSHSAYSPPGAPKGRNCAVHRTGAQKTGRGRQEGASEGSLSKRWTCVGLRGSEWK